MKRIMSWGVFVAGPVLSAAWLFGWIAKERWPSLMWFYFIPTPAAVLCLGGWLVWFRRGRARAWRILIRTVAVIMLLKIACVDFAWHRPGARGVDSIRIVHWNTARGIRGAERVYGSLVQEKADICLLSESPNGFNAEGLAPVILGMPYAWNESGMTLLSRFPFDPMSAIPLDNAYAWSARVMTPRGPLDVVAVDLVSRPNLNRFAPMRELAAWMDQRDPTMPMVMLGDFNTPRDSLSFEPVRRRLVHAYEKAGGGWPYSWPVPFPVYAIDHAWISPSIRILDYRLRTTLLSDHRRQILDIAW